MKYVARVSVSVTKWITIEGETTAEIHASDEVYDKVLKGEYFEEDEETREIEIHDIKFEGR